MRKVEKRDRKKGKKDGEKSGVYAKEKCKLGEEQNKKGEKRRK